jgi:nucleotide-binding universal stress UspA family protein
MKKILVPTDFSSNALKAALYAAEIAKRSGATVYFLHAMEMGVEKIYAPFSLHDKYERLVMEDRKTKLEEFSGNIIKDYPSVKTATALEHGIAVDSILDFCVQKKIELIVMGTKGAGAVKERLIGTVAAGIVGKSKVPVLVVPEEYQLEEPDAILFLTNHFEKNKRLLRMIINLAQLFSAEIKVGLFVDVNEAEAAEYLSGNRSINEYLKFLKTSYPGIKFTGELIEGEDFESAIELYHAVHETDIAAMITYPKGFWEKVLHKSATKKMTFRSKTPILAIPHK